MSDLNLLKLHRETVRLTGKGRKLRPPLAASIRHDYSECPGLGSFRGLLDLLSETYKWPEAEIAVPAALAVFVPQRLWTQEHIPEIRNAIAAVRAFMGPAPAERAWEFAMGWLLGANGRAVVWNSDGWEGPMNAWSSFSSLVFECVAATCLYLGSPLKFRIGNLERDTRVPHFNNFVGREHRVEWTKQICEALTGRNGARCLCASLHSLFLRDREAAAHEAVSWAAAKGLPKAPGLKTPNAVKKIHTHDSWHHLGAWDGSLPLALFLRRAVRGGSKKIKTGEIPSGMLFHLLRDATGLEQALVAVKKCRPCTEAWQEQHDRFYPDSEEQVSDVISFYPDRCDQCNHRFVHTDFPFARRMLILSRPGCGFVGRKASVCGEPNCAVVFDPSSATDPPTSEKGILTCPKCNVTPSQRKSWVYYFQGDNPSAPVAGSNQGPLTPNADALAVLDEGDFTWIRELVEILVERNNSQPSEDQPPLPDDALDLLKDVPGSPRDMGQMRSKWLALKALWGEFEDRALRSP